MKRKTNITKKANQKQYRKRKIIVLFIILTLVVAALLFNRYNNASNKTMTDPSGVKETINYDKPSSEDQKNTEEEKSKLLEKEVAPAKIESDGRKQVKPTITSADQKEVMAYVTGIFEENGVCTVSYVKDSVTITATSKGFGNASYTSCEPLILTEQLPSKGVWTVTVAYDSSTSIGTSDAIKVSK